MVVFVDRFAADSYVFHPLRFGKFQSFREETDYLYATVELENFIYPRDLKEFNRRFVEALVPSRIPKLTGKDPESRQDGYYIVAGDDVFGRANEFLSGDPAWSAIVDNISTTRALATDARQAPVFFRSRIRQDGNPSSFVHAKRKGSAAYCQLFTGDTYGLILSYRFPRQQDDFNARTQLQISYGESLRPLDSPVLSVDSQTNSPVKNFTTKRYIEETSGSITLSAAHKVGDAEVLFADAPIPYKIKESKKFWLSIAFFLLLFSVAGSLIGVDFAKVVPLTFLQAASIKLLFGFAQAFSLFWLLRLVGKKVL